MWSKGDLEEAGTGVIFRISFLIDLMAGQPTLPGHVPPPRNIGLIMPY